MKRFVIVAAVVGAVAGLGAQAVKAVPVFVTSVGAANGLTDPNKETCEAARDITAALKGQPDVRVVPSRDEAAIVVVVQSYENAAVPVAGEANREVTIRAKFVYKGAETDVVARRCPEKSRACSGRTLARARFVRSRNSS